MVSGTFFSELTPEQLVGCVNKYGPEKTMLAVDICRSKKPKKSDNLAGYLWSALEMGLSPPTLFVPFIKQKTRKEQKKKEEQEAAEVKADLLAETERRKKSIQSFWSSLQESDQREHVEAIRREMPQLSSDIVITQQAMIRAANLVGI